MSGGGLTILGDLLSQPSRAVYLFCRINNIPHTFKPVRFQGLIHRTASYTKINPFQTIPCIIDGDFILRDSGAIFVYLINTRPDRVKDHWYPKDLHKRARVDEYLSWHHINPRGACFAYNFNKWVGPTITGKKPKPEFIAKKQERMESVFDQIEKVWLSEGRAKFINDTDEITLADLQLACELENLNMSGYEIRKMRPILGKYLEGVRETLNPHYDEAHEGVWEVVRMHPNGQIPGKLITIKRFAEARIKHMLSPL